MSHTRTEQAPLFLVPASGSPFLPRCQGVLPLSGESALPLSSGAAQKRPFDATHGATLKEYVEIRRNALQETVHAAAHQHRIKIVQTCVAYAIRQRVKQLGPFENKDHAEQAIQQAVEQQRKECEAASRSKRQQFHSGEPYVFDTKNHHDLQQTIPLQAAERQELAGAVSPPVSPLGVRRALQQENGAVKKLDLEWYGLSPLPPLWQTSTPELPAARFS